MGSAHSSMEAIVKMHSGVQLDGTAVFFGRHAQANAVRLTQRVPMFRTREATEARCGESLRFGGPSNVRGRVISKPCRNEHVAPVALGGRDGGREALFVSIGELQHSELDSLDQVRAGVAG